jgi:hypothetical protein
LRHVAIVRSLSQIGSLKTRTGFAKDVPLSGGESEDRAIAFVQEPGPGRVRGAALLNVATAAAGNH